MNTYLKLQQYSQQIPRVKYIKMRVEEFREIPILWTK